MVGKQSSSESCLTFSISSTCLTTLRMMAPFQHTKLKDASASSARITRPVCRLAADVIHPDHRHHPVTVTSVALQISVT